LSEVYLVDTNAYVRIARHSQGVLGQQGQLTLMMVSEITSECSRSRRLKEEFAWMHEPPHPKIRSHATLNFRDTQKAKIKKTTENLAPYMSDLLAEFKEARASRGQPGAVLSPPDKAVFFAAHAMGYGVVTDEGPMSLLCKEFGVKHLTTFGLLRYLFKSELVTRAQIDEMVIAWQVQKDEPKQWRRAYMDLFKERPPVPTVL
jgi:hypothetical protein